jgi:hypothetical protein
MVSVEKAQQQLRDKGYSQTQVDQMTAEATALLNILVDQYLKDKRIDNNKELTV